MKSKNSIVGIYTASIMIPIYLLMAQCKHCGILLIINNKEQKSTWMNEDTHQEK